MQNQKGVAIHAETFQPSREAKHVVAVKADSRKGGTPQRVTVGKGVRQLPGRATHGGVADPAEEDRPLPGQHAGKTQRRVVQLRGVFRKQGVARLKAGGVMSLHDGDGGIRHGCFPNISLYAKAYLLTRRGKRLAVAAGIS